MEGGVLIALGAVMGFVLAMVVVAAWHDADADSKDWWARFFRGDWPQDRR